MAANSHLEYLDELTKNLTFDDGKKEEEARIFRALSDDSFDGWWKWNLSTDLVEFCPRWAKILGYEDGNLNRTLDDIRAVVVEEDRNKFDDSIRHHIYDGKKLKFMVRFLRKDGTLFKVLCIGQVLLDDDGVPESVIGIQIDLSDL